MRAGLVALVLAATAGCTAALFDPAGRYKCDPISGADCPDGGAAGGQGGGASTGGGAGGGASALDGLTQQAYLKASNTDAIDMFGKSVAISADGRTLAVGAPRESSAAAGPGASQADNSAQYAGAVYVFTKSGTSWVQQQYLKASNPGAQDLFGFSVALSADGTTLAVGAYGEASAAAGLNGNQADNSAANTGAVYVFTRSAGAWTQQAYVKASNTKDNQDFGTSVALAADGQTLAVGAANEASNATGINGDQTDASASNAGAVYVFARSGASWTQQAYVKASNAEASDAFSEGLALSATGDVLAAGAANEESAAAGINGSQSNNSAHASGAAYVFVRSGGAWAQRLYVKAFNPGVGDHFGLALGLSADGLTLVAGATGESSNATGVNRDGSNDSATSAGAAYVFSP